MSIQEIIQSGVNVSITIGTNDLLQPLFSDILLNAQKYGIMAQKICEMTATAKK